MCCRFPLVAVIVTGKLFGVEVVEAPPPHPVKSRDVAVIPASNNVRLRSRPILRRIRPEPTNGNSNRAKASRAILSLVDGDRAIALTADVWIVTVTVWVPAPAAMLPGEKAAVAPVGKPLATKVTIPG